MTKEKAIEILAKSIDRLHKKRGELFITDIEAEVINNACLYCLTTPKEPGKYYGSDTVYHTHVAQCFTDAAKKLFPSEYVEVESAAAMFHIVNNLKWGGMWNFLKKYFLENHHIEIDDVELETKEFNSYMHQRYEYGVNVSGDELVERLVSIDYVGGDENVLVRISPTLSPKEATLHHKVNNKVIYHSNDGTYVFTLFMDEFDELESFTLDIPQRGLQIKYF
jgi:hypothetical protein